jgi:hypothetical protein
MVEDERRDDEFDGNVVGPFELIAEFGGRRSAGKL